MMNLLHQCKSLQQGLNYCRCAPGLNHIAVSGGAEWCIQTLENAQLQVANLKSETKLLKEKVIASTIKVFVLCGNSKKDYKRAANPTLPYTDNLKNLRKKFAIMQEPWLKPSIFC